MFIQIRKDQTRSTKVHIYQTDGVTDSIIPHWKTFDISELANVEILDNKPKFEIAEGYVPDSKMYNNVIVKV